MSERRAQITTAEYTPEKISELISRKERCQVVLKVPKIFSDVARASVPTQREACEWNKLPAIKSRNADSSHSRQRGWGGETDAQEIADAHGWEFVECGAHRCGFIVRNGKTILKVGKPEVTFQGINGYKANKNETVTTLVADEAVRKVVAPVVSHSTKNFKWIAVPKARTKDTDALTDSEQTYAYREVNRLLDEAQADCMDIHHGNVGLLAGHPVAIDIGQAMICRRRKREQRELTEFLPPKHLGTEELIGAVARKIDEKRAPRVLSTTARKHEAGIEKLMVSQVGAFMHLPESAQARIRREVLSMRDDVRKLMSMGRYNDAWRQAHNIGEKISEARKSKPYEGLGVGVPADEFLGEGKHWASQEAKAWGIEPEATSWGRKQANIIHDQAVEIMMKKPQTTKDLRDADFLLQEARKIARLGRKRAGIDASKVMNLLDSKHRRMLAKLGVEHRGREQGKSPDEFYAEGRHGQEGAESAKFRTWSDSHKRKAVLSQIKKNAAEFYNLDEARQAQYQQKLIDVHLDAQNARDDKRWTEAWDKAMEGKRLMAEARLRQAVVG